MFGLKRKKPFVLDVEKSTQLNVAMHAYEEEGDFLPLFGLLGADGFAAMCTDVRKMAAADAAKSQLLMEGK